MNKELIDLYKQLFPLFASLNDYFLSEEDKVNTNFIDAMIFQGTSYAMSIMRYSYFDASNSYLRCYLVRCLIENITLIKMYDAGKLHNISSKLFSNFPYIIEYRMFKRYKKLFDEIYDPTMFEAIENNYHKAYDIYKKHLKLKDDEDLNNRLKWKIPYLSKDVNFANLVKLYFTDFYGIYLNLSLCAHPHNYIATFDYIYKNDLNSVEFNLLHILADIIAKRYMYKLKPTFKSLEIEEGILKTSSLNQEFLTLTYEQGLILTKFGETFSNFTNFGSASVCFIDLANSINCLALDHLLGSSEVVKISFRYVIEMISYMLSLNNEPHCKEYFDLLELHTKVQLLKINNEEYENYIREAFLIAKDLYGDKEYEKFKNRFLRPYGYENKNHRIKDVVFNLFDCHIKNKTQNQSAKLLYDESVVMSHANGYLLNCSTGTFKDSIQCIEIIDILISIMLTGYWNVWDVYEKLNSNKCLREILNKTKGLLSGYDNVLKKKLDLAKYENLKVKY